MANHPFAPTTPPLPTTDTAPDAAVFAVDSAGRTCERCVRCGAWTPLWGAIVIRIGRIVRRANPNHGHVWADRTPHPYPHPQVIDHREFLWSTDIRSGTGCPDCVAAFDALCRTRPDTPNKRLFLPVNPRGTPFGGEFPMHRTAPHIPARARRRR
jgi:hypothetical protein